MKSAAQHNTAILPLVIAAALACFWLLPKAQAVVPAPDGGYPGGNTAEGQNALLSLSTGGYNTAVGFYSLRGDTTASFNTAIGAGTLFTNIADQNTATGAGALFRNNSGGSNTANGAFALFNNIGGSNNTAVGSNALLQNIDGVENTAVGYDALVSNVHGNYNTAIGYTVLLANGGDYNTAIGYQTLYSHVNGNYNTAIGANALVDDSSGNSNTAGGALALNHNTTGTLNTGFGIGALYSNTDGTSNTAVGYQSLYNLGSGSYNVAVAGGFNLSSGNFNIDIGNDGVGGDSGVIRIGSSCCQSSTFIAGIYGVTASGGAAVYVNSSGQLGTATSSARFKQDIQSMDKASEAVLALRPVTFRYKPELDRNGIPQYGLVAEDVEKVNPDLVVRDKDGKPYTVRYEAVNAMVLNEFLKEHRKVQAQEAIITQLKQDFQFTVAKQQKQIEALTSGLQKVSAQLETSKPAPQVVGN